MKNFILICFIILIFTGQLRAQCGCLGEDINGKSGVVPKYEFAEKVFDTAFFTEGPASAYNGKVYFSDITFTSELPNNCGHIFVYDQANGETNIYRSPSNMSNGMLIDNSNNLIICEGADTGGRRITKTNLETGKNTIVASSYNGNPFNSPNDLTIDAEGNIYFTDPRYSGDEKLEQPVMGVYKIDSAGIVKLIIDNISMPNGIALSPGEEYLYVSCNDESVTENKFDSLYAGMFITRYKKNIEGDFKFDKIFAEFYGGYGPDGMTFDSEGNLYTAVRNENDPAVWVFNHDGETIDWIRLPEVPSNVCFGKGNYKNILYITAGGSLYKINVKNSGLN